MTNREHLNIKLQMIRDNLSKIEDAVREVNMKYKEATRIHNTINHIDNITLHIMELLEK